MHNRARIVAGTALALVMTAAHAGASAQAGAPPPVEPLRTLAQAAPDGKAHERPLLLAQADEEEEEDGEATDRAVEPVPGDEQPPAEEAPPPPPEEVPPPPEEAPPPPEEAPAPPEEAPAPPEEAPAPPEEAPAPPEEAPAPPEEAPPPATETPPPADGGGAEPIPDAPTPPAAEDAPMPPAQEAPPPATETPPPADGGGVEPIPGAPTPPPAEGAPTPPPAEGTAPETEGGVEPVREAPILDSEKEADGQPPEATQQPVEEATPPPASDEEAQQFEEPIEVEPLRAEEGRRVERREERRERPEGANVLREIGDRIVVQFGTQVIVQSDDRGRIGRDAEEVYYEELPRGRTRETVVRPNGVQVVTVYDRYGDVIRRSRIMPDGREHVLVYAGGGREREERRQWRDPGLDLPPLRLTIPRDEYILDAGRVHDEQTYYDFLHQPPVDRVRRLYSVDEVRYSARVRDSVRRIDLDTITFEFGSASISEEAIPRLAGVAEAMERLLDENPGEMFLIEGHTDAVGSNEANLALSDRRAEGVATALTSVFDIPPENLVTQGYGEHYLKINTQEPEQENRRVAIRRITPLVAPMASAR